MTSSRSSIEEGETETTISELPDHLIQHIFSFLESKRAARASLVSKSLFREWSTRPVLDFQSKFTQNFADVVNNTLRNFHQKRIPIQKFRLHVEEVYQDYIVCREINNLEMNFRTWLQMTILIVLRRDIQELDLSTLNYRFVLIDGDVKCRNLKKLKLNRVGISECTFHYLISSCPLIEELHLEKCSQFTKIHAPTIPNLRTFYFSCYFLKEINVNLPRLESFTCDHIVGMINLGECTSLKSLSISKSHFFDESLPSLLSKNPLLENLRLDSCSTPGKLMISSQCLKSLRIVDLLSLELGIDAPNLHFLEYTSPFPQYQFPQDQFPLHIRNPTGKGKSDITLCFINGEIYADWFRSLREFLTKFRKSTIRVAPYERECHVWLSKESFQVIPLPSEHEVELVVDYEHKYIPLIGRLLSMCHPKSIICEYDSNVQKNKDRIRDLCQKLRREKSPQCCGSSRIKCWQHYIMDAKLFYVVKNERKPLDWISLMIPSKAPIELRQEHRWRIAFSLEWKPL